jgi:hypothetical protein
MPKCCPHVECLLFLERRIVQHDSPIVTSNTIDQTVPLISTNPMSTSARNHPQNNGSVFTYRTATITTTTTTTPVAAASGSIHRSRASTDIATNSIVLTGDKIKSNMPASIRSTRSVLTHAPVTSPALISAQQTQRYNGSNSKTRISPDKLAQTRGKQKIS